MALGGGGALCAESGGGRDPACTQPTHTAIPGPVGATAARARQPTAARESDASSPQGPRHLAQGTLQGEAREQSLPPTHPDRHPDPGMDASPQVSEPHWLVAPCSMGGRLRREESGLGQASLGCVGETAFTQTCGCRAGIQLGFQTSTCSSLSPCH